MRVSASLKKIPNRVLSCGSKMVCYDLGKVWTCYHLQRIHVCGLVLALVLLSCKHDRFQLSYTVVDLTCGRR